MVEDSVSLWHQLFGMRLDRHGIHQAAKGGAKEVAKTRSYTKIGDSYG